MMIPPNSSLVKYDNPVLVVEKTGDIEKVTANGHGAIIPGKTVEPSEEILDSILPPREWEQDGDKWVQHVSSTPATRIDVLNLQEQLDTKLQQRQARETGICPIRRELYDQCFDEVIRQVAISCAERGLLLLRVRDELRMTLAAYQTLYESSVAFGIRKALQAEHSKVDTEAQVEKLNVDNGILKHELNEWKAKCEQIERRMEEQLQLREKQHEEVINGLKRTNENFKAQLEAIIAPRNK